MDAATVSRLREFLIDIGQRQRPSPPDADAVRRRMLASTFRLAGHTVSQNPRAAAKPAANQRPADADDATLAGNIVQTADSLRSNRHAVSGNPSGATGSDATVQPDRAALADDAHTDDNLEFEEPAPVGDASPSEAAESADVVATPYDLGLSDETAPPVEAAPVVAAPADHPLLSQAPNRLESSFALTTGGFSQPPPGSSYDISRRGADGTFRSAPAVPEPFIVRPGAAPPDRSQYMQLEAQADSTSTDPDGTPAADFADSMPVADLFAGDTPSDLPIAIDGDSPILADPGPPVSGPQYAGTDASAPLDQRSEGSWSNSPGGEDSGGGSPQPGGEGQSSGAQPSIIVLPTAGLVERFTNAAADRALSLAQSTVDAAVSELRGEISVNRAAYSALFPR